MWCDLPRQSQENLPNLPAARLYSAGKRVACEENAWRHKECQDANRGICTYIHGDTIVLNTFLSFRPLKSPRFHVTYQARNMVQKATLGRTRQTSHLWAILSSHSLCSIQTCTVCTWYFTSACTYKHICAYIVQSTFTCVQYAYTLYNLHLLALQWKDIWIGLVEGGGGVYRQMDIAAYSPPPPHLNMAKDCFSYCYLSTAASVIPAAMHTIFCHLCSNPTTFWHPCSNAQCLLLSL